MKKYVTALTIAGSDSSGGAGIQADIKTFSALGVYGMSVLTALTAQNTCGVKSIFKITPKFIQDQLNAIFEDIQVDAVKIGMLHRAEIIEVVAERLQYHQAKNIVLDPVMIAKGGANLLREDAVEALKKLLLPLACVVTPNIPEAEVLLKKSIQSNKEIENSAAKLLKSGVQSVLIKGGHLNSKSSSDCLAVTGKTNRIKWFYSERIQTKNTHGTGCTLSAAITAFLALGENLESAVSKAKIYLTEALYKGAQFQLGQGHGPVYHFYYPS